MIFKSRKKKGKNPFRDARRKIRGGVDVVVGAYIHEIETMDNLNGLMEEIKNQLGNHFRGFYVENIEYDRVREQVVIDSRLNDGSPFRTRVLIGKWIKNTPIKRFDFDF